jgi:hypothetical protein
MYLEAITFILLNGRIFAAAGCAVCRVLVTEIIAVDYVELPL